MTDAEPNGECRRAATSRDVSQMQLVCLRTIPFIETGCLAFREGKEALFRHPERGFLLYLSEDVQCADERLETREALIWLNEKPDDEGSFWIWGTNE